MVSPDGESVYVAGFAAVVKLKRNVASGPLIPKGCVADDSAPALCAQVSDGLNGTSSVAVSPDGASVYAAARFDEAVVQFLRDAGS